MNSIEQKTTKKKLLQIWNFTAARLEKDSLSSQQSAFFALYPPVDYFWQCKLQIEFHSHPTLSLCSFPENSKVSKRKITKKLSDKCVHCYVKVEIENLKDFVTCKGCEELACHNQKCSEFVFGLDIWECTRCRKNRWVFSVEWIRDYEYKLKHSRLTMKNSVIHQRAGEWLLKQLNQMKDLELHSKVTSESRIMNTAGESLCVDISICVIFEAKVKNDFPKK